LRVVAGAVSTVSKILFRIFSSFFSYPNYFRILLLLIAILISIVHLNAQTYVFARLDGIPMNTTGWTLKGEAAVKNVAFTNNSELLLCSAKNNTSGAVFFNQPINLSLCSRWKAEFDFRMNGGTAADGIAFNFLDAPPTGFVLGQGLGIPSGANGLKVCFDTYNNCITPTSYKVPKIEIRYGAGYNECSPQPTLENINNSLSFIRSATYNHALITYDNGNITVSVNGTVLLTATQFFNFSGYLGFTASTGGSTDNHSIKNVIIYTDMPPSEAGSNLVSTCNIINAGIGTSTTAGYTYTWSPASGLSNTAISNPTVQITNNTGSTILQKYYVKTAFSSNPGCYSMDSVTVQVKPKPAVSFTGSIPAVCSNAAAFTVTGGSPAGGVYSGPGITGASFSPNSAGVGTHTITYTYTDVSGCTNAATNTIRVNAIAQVVARNDVAICTGTSVALTATNASSYLWSPNVGLSTTTGSSITASPLTSTTYTVTARDVNGCSSSDQVVVAVQSMPTASIRYAGSPFCGNIQVPIILTGLTGGTFSAPVGLSIQPTTGTINLAASTPGVYSVTYTFSNGACTNFTKTDVTILAPPVVTFNNVLPTACFSGSAISVTGGTPVGGVYSGAGISGANFQPTIAGRGIHVITYTYTLLGCTNSATNTITVYPIENVVASSPVAICSGGSVMISATNASSYLWSPATGLSSTTGASVMASPLTTTLYTVTGLDNASGCSSQDQVTVTFLQAPVASINYPGSPFCHQGTIGVSQTGQSGGTYQSTAGLVLDGATGLINLSNSTPGTYTVTYTFTNGGCGSFTQTSVTILPPPTVMMNDFSPVCFTTAPFTLAGGFPMGGTYTGPGITGGTFSPLVAGRGIHTLSYTYTNVSGCIGSITSTIIVNPLTPVAAITDQTTCFGQTVTLTAVQSVSYQWMPGGLSGSSVLVTPFTNTRYTVTGTHADGCVSQDDVWVLVIPTPVATITYPGSPFCNAGMASVSLRGQAGGIFSAALGLQLDVNNGSIDLANSNPGTYTVTYTFSNGVCTEITQTILTILAPPVVSYKNSFSSVCNNATPLLLSGGLPLGGTYTGVGIVAGTFNPSLAGRGVHTITYTYTTAQGCVNSATQSITVNPLVDVDAGSDLSVCIGSSAIITASNAVLYAWSPSSNLSAVSGSEIIATPLTTTTYYVTGTDAAGCTSTDEVMITVYSLPVASIQYAAPVFCNTGIALVTQSGQPDGIFSADAGLIINTSSGAIDLAASIPGSYTVTYTFSNGTCSNQTTTNLTILVPASVSFSVTLSSVCATAAPFAISGGSPLGGIYSGPGITGETFSPAAAGTGVHVLTYLYTNAGGCLSAATTSITVNPLVSVQASADVAVCLGSSVSLTAINAYNYSWSPNQNLSATTGAMVEASPLTTTTYTVTGIDANGCSSSDAVVVTVLPLPTATISYPGNPFCKTGIINVVRTGIAGGVYSASSGLVLNSITGAIDLSASNAGTYSVTYTFSNGSCSNQLTTLVTIIDLPIVSFTGNLPAACIQAAPFTVTGGNPLGGVYRGVGIKGDIINPQLAGLGKHVIEYTYTNPKGCAAMATNTITITSVTGGNTTLQFPEVCVGSNPFTLVTGSTVPAGGQFSGAGVNTNIFDPQQAGIGNNIITYVTNAVSGCSVEYSGTIQVNPKPTLQVASLKKVCEGNQVVISPIASGELFWSDSTGTLNRFASNGLTFKPKRSISYLITCRDGKGCTNSQPVFIQVDPVPDASFSYGSTNFCSGGNATVLMAGLSGGNFSADLGVSINTTNGQIDLSNTQPGNHTITYSVTNTAGCRSVSQQTITVKPVPVLSLSNLILCSGSVQAITFTGSSVGSSFNSNNPAIAAIDASGVVQGLQAGQALVRFTNNDGCTSNVAVTVKDLPRLSGKQLVCKLDSIQVSTNATLGDIAKFVSQTPGIASVNTRGIVRGNRAGTAIIEFRDNNGCSATHILKVDSVPQRQPAPTFTCEPGTIRLDQPMISAYGSSGYTFTYWKDSAQTAMINNPMRIAQSGNYFVQVNNANACRAEKPVKVKVAVAKAIIARRLDTVRTQNNVPVQLKARMIGTEFSWTPSTGLNSPFIREPWFSHMKNMEYQVSMRTDSGCLVTDTVFVKAVDANIFVPSAFTPNTDGKNDKFAPVCYSIARLNFFSVFNRWGELIFTTNTIGKGWDGTNKGAAAEAGTYVWMLEAVGLDGQVFRQKGTVVLIR
jgi:gliding motility-associated-like protein